MKVRICPNCGKQNLESTVNCSDCGTTLSMKTIVDLDEANTARNTEFVSLMGISPFFEEKKVEILKTIKEGFEKVLWGGNITQVSRKSPFRFGFVVITTQRLITVYFHSKTDHLGKPSRAHFEYVEIIGGSPIKSLLGSIFHQETGTLFALEDPQEELLPTECASCEIKEHDLKDLTSSSVKKLWLGDILLENVIAKFRQGDILNITFCLTENAGRLHNLLIASLI